MCRIVWMTRNRKEVHVERWSYEVSKFSAKHELEAGKTDRECKILQENKEFEAEGLTCDASS